MLLAVVQAPLELVSRELMGECTFATPVYRGPKDYINIRISHSGSKAQ